MSNASVDDAMANGTLQQNTKACSLCKLILACKQIFHQLKEDQDVSPQNGIALCNILDYLHWR